MREITLEVQGRCGDLLKLQVTTDTSPLDPDRCPPLRLTLPALDPAEISSPAASFLRLNRDPANNVLHFLSPQDWLELEGTSRGGRIAVGGSACWRQELGGKVAYLARRRAFFRVSRAFQVGSDGRVSNVPQEICTAVPTQHQQSQRAPVERTIVHITTLHDNTNRAHSCTPVLLYTARRPSTLARCSTAKSLYAHALAGLAPVELHARLVRLCRPRVLALWFG